MSNLFRMTSVNDLYNNLCQTIRNEVGAISEADFISCDHETLASSLIAKYQIDCPVLDAEPHLDDFEVSEGATSAYLTFRLGFRGDPQLFSCHAGGFPDIHDDVKVNKQELVLSIRADISQLQYTKNTTISLFQRIRDHMIGMENVISKSINPNFKQVAISAIKNRKDAIGKKHQDKQAIMEKLGFPIRKRDDGNERIIVPLKPTNIVIQPTSHARSNSESKPFAEPELSLADYDQIIDVIRSMVTVYERSPSVFHKMEEEHLRTILLVGLNGLFKGNATGETFNGAGKTDILIRVEDKNIFIAECLIWCGPEHFKKKLTEQLFNYATWRDSKLTAIIFNRNKDFTSVVQKMKEVVAGFSNRISDLPYPVDTGCRSKFKREDDPNKQFVLTCLAFEVPGGK